MTRGIYLVANRRVEQSAANLVYSIRRSGCTLPIALIPFDDDPPTHRRLLVETTPMPVESFPAEAQSVVAEMGRMWATTKPGLFRRFLAWYGPYDEFIYSDNDIVALGDWAPYFEGLDNVDLVHADQEFITGGIFNYRDPSVITRELGAGVMESLVTSGHFTARKREGMTAIFERTLAWIREHPGVLVQHDQPFLHLAILLGQLSTRNLCRPPDNWPSSWAGDYRNTLDVVQAAQGPGRLLHLHYSGGTGGGYAAREDFCYADHKDGERLWQLVRTAFGHASGYHYVTGQFARGLKRRLAARSKTSKDQGT